MKEQNWKSAIIVTSDYHTRRTRMVYERASKGLDLIFYYYASKVEDSTGHPVSYLKHPDKWRLMGLELIKYYGYLFHLYHWINLKD